MLDAVLQRFVAECPVAVMARLTLQRAISAEWVDGLFEAHRERQYTRELLFSTVVDLMGLVALGLRPSLHAAAQRARATGALDVSLVALYAKVNHSEPAVLRALVAGSAERLAPVVAALQAPPGGPGARPEPLPGYRVRIVDGNHLPASEKRLTPLRGLRAAALPAQALVVYEPATGLVLDHLPEPDAHAGERTLLPALLERAGPGELWLADRNFATRAILAALAARGTAVLVREGRANPRPTPEGPRQCVGRGDTGVVYEQAVTIPGAPERTAAARAVPRLRLRRIEVELDQPTEDGETVIRLLTTLPAAHATALDVATLYRRRWTIEGMFQRLEAVLHSEVRPLGHPRAALLAFSVAVVAYNVLAVVQAAVEAEAAAQAAAVAEAGPSTGPTPVPISMYYLAHEVREYYRGLLVAVAPAVWAHYDQLDAVTLARALQHLATHVRLSAFRKHSRKATPTPTPDYVPRREVQRHVATERLLKQQQPATPREPR